MIGPNFTLAGKPLSDKRAQLLSGIAEAYYNEGLNQNEIAERFGVTRSAISRHLTDARAAGIVMIHVRALFDLDVAASASLSQAYPGIVFHVLATLRQTEQTRDALLSAFAANLVHDRLTDGMGLLVSMGRSVRDIVNTLAVRDTVRVNVIQLCGSTGPIEGGHDAQTSVLQLADAYRCQCTLLPAPYFVESRIVKDVLDKNAAVQACGRAAASAGIAIIGLGALDVGGPGAMAEAAVPGASVARIAVSGACGDIGGYPVDAAGRAVSDAGFNPILALDFAAFRKVPLRVAILDRDALIPVAQAALAGGAVSDLVLSSQAAERLLALQTSN